MAIYRIMNDTLETVPETTFEANNLKERGDLQRLLRERIEIVAPDTLVIAEEYGNWDDSKRRIDLLGVDKQGNLVVIELKRTEDGGHMELQALRYASMVSAMTFEQAAVSYSHLSQKMEEEARAALLEFLGWPEPQEDNFAKEVRIVLVSANFSKEMTTTVMWLNERDLDIRCVRLRPYSLDGTVLIDVQQVLPLREAADYQIKIKEKKIQELISKQSTRVNYNLTLNGNLKPLLPKSHAIREIVKHLINLQHSPNEIASKMPKKSNLWLTLPGTLDTEQFKAYAAQQGNIDLPRWFYSSENLIHLDGETWLFTTQWGKDTDEAMQMLQAAYPEAGIEIEKIEPV